MFVHVDATKSPLLPRYVGPYLVLKQLRNTAVLQIGDKTETVSLAHIKPYHTDKEVQVAQPPRRGRPRGRL